MQIVEVIPLLRTVALKDETLSYFSTRDDVPSGALVRVSVRNKSVPAVITQVRDLAAERFRLRKSVPFALKPLSGFLSDGPVIPQADLDLSKWLAQYYAVPQALALRLFFPRYIETHAGTLKLKALGEMPGALVGVAPVLKKKIISGSLAARFKEYASLAVAATQSGGSVLLLFPDLSRAQAFLERHGAAIPGMLLFTGQAPGRKHYLDWEAIRSGAARVVAGTRSALFAPMAHPAAIIVDEPSSEFYKSDLTRPYYHVARVAEEKARRSGAALVLGSELFFPFEGHSPRPIAPAAQTLRNIRIVSLKAERADADQILTKTVKNALSDLVRSKGQAVIFMNRRGAAPLTQCQDCGFILRCQHCDAPLVMHHHPIARVYRCHHCGAASRPPDLCPNCNGARLKLFVGGTQEIEAEIKRLQPELTVFRLDSDIASDAKKERAVISDFRNTSPAVLVGTQLVVKLRLPGFQPYRPVRFIALASIDPLLRLPDIGMRERVLRMILALMQIPHEDFFIQTYNPEDPFFGATGEGRISAFARTEAAERSALGYPPYGALVKLTFRHRSDTRALGEAETLYRRMSAFDLKKYGCALLGPVPAFIARERGKYVWQLLVRMPPGMPLAARNEILADVPPSWEIDVDPVTLL